MRILLSAQIYSWRSWHPADTEVEREPSSITMASLQLVTVQHRFYCPERWKFGKEGQGGSDDCALRSRGFEC